MKQRINFLYVCVIVLVFFSSLVYGAIPAEERAALIALYNSTDGDNWTNNTGWKTPPLHTDGFAMPGTEGNWYGISASDDHVGVIELHFNQLSGNLPSELGNLNNLRYLSLENNQLSGSIPKELGNLSNLKWCYLQNNQLTGSIPSELGNLNNLEWIKLNSNQLSGNIPATMWNITGLTHIFFSENQLTGNIPAEIGNLINLKWLKLDANSLTGNIPMELGNLSNLEVLFLENNKLTGSIPPELGNLSNLQTLTLDSNQLTGTIPPQLGNLNNLSNLDLTANNLSGNIPSELGNLSNLTGLDLVANQLSGSIPPELGNLSKLEGLLLNSNQLTGSIPSTLGNLTNLDVLYLCYNKLSGAIPKSLMNLTKLGVPYVDFGDNCLYTNDAELKAWLDTVDPDWETRQDACGFTLTVQSSPDSGIPITVSPADSYGQGDGSTEFFRTFDIDTVVTLTAPASHSGKLFVKWLIDGTENVNRIVQVTMDSNHTAQTVYQSVAYTLTVQSFPSTGIGITVSPNDNSGNGDGNTNFTRIYNSGTVVTLAAPSAAGSDDFVKWTVDGNDYTEKTIQVTMDNNHTAVAYYSLPPKISVNRSRLNFGYVKGSSNMPAESFTISNSGGGTLNWNASTEMHRVGLNPESGTNSGDLEVSIDPVGLSSGKFKGVIYISDSLASNSPVEVEIHLWVKTQSESLPPFGDFATPEDNSTVSSSVPVTGWALGDTGIESVKIYREDGKGLVYIGDTGFVEGARPDIETGYPDYPMNYKAGWGYMMLTNFLPNGGNGVFKIHAIATDKEGQASTLGVKTITVDNANAVKPFGAIDTPAQGGTASGSNYRNQGWVLTPPPNKIPEDGSTINVFVDGVNLGLPVYNVYREDIAQYFPDYANSNGAHAYFDFDTTTYTNGIHTIFWTAEDDAGNSDGIGSRYFTIQNSQSTYNRGQKTEDGGQLFTLSGIPVDYSGPVMIKRGYRKDAEPQETCSDDSGIIHIAIKELERLEIQLSRDTSEIYGYMVVGSQLKPLPIGSTLDARNAIFYWQPGPGFFGEYRLIFIEKKASGDISKKEISVNISPKFKDKKNETTN
jgi:Leucine-rich repeat (LRR) protein